MRRTAPFSPLAGALLSLLAAPMAAQDAPTNLRVLPDTLSRSEVVAEMRQIASALGVSCSHCHARVEGGAPNELDHAADTNPLKLRAREMLKMTARINSELLPAAVGGAGSGLSVECITCHRGAPRPVMLEDSLHRVITTEGIDSAVAVYHHLRARYANRFAYDFGERMLTTLGSMLVAERKLADARRVMELNAEQYPESWNVAYELGVVYEEMGETRLAIEQYRKAFAIQPRATHVKRRLDNLTGG